MIRHEVDIVSNAMPEKRVSNEKKFFRDRCWASLISAIGGAAAIGSAIAIKKEQYEVATALSAVSAGADFLDGKEARRYAKRHPEEAAKRANRGAAEDKFWDKIRNIVLGATIASDKNYSKSARVSSGLMAVREGIVAGASIWSARKFKQEGVPIEELNSMPSSPIGKETMWEYAGGETFATAAVIAKQHGHEEAGKNLDHAGTFMFVVGIFRGIQSAIEYKKQMALKIEALRNGDTEWEPDYQPHIGTIVVNIVRGLGENTPLPPPEMQTEAA